jgi:signal transduction histidine kinase
MLHFTLQLPVLVFRSAMVFVLSFCISFTSGAQDLKLKQGTDTSLIVHLCDAARQQHFPDSQLLLANRAYEMSIAGNYVKGILYSLDRMSIAWYNKCNYPESIRARKKMLEYCRRPAGRANVYFSIGDGYFFQGDYVLASENYDSGLHELENNHIDNPDCYMRVYIALARMDHNLNEDTSALMYSKKAEEIARKLKSYQNLVTILFNKRGLYLDEKRFDSALTITLEAKKIITEQNFREREMDINVILGELYVDSGQYEKAITYLQQALSPSNMNTAHDADAMFIAGSYLLGKALYHLGKYKQAEAVILPAINKSLSLNSKGNITEGYSTLSDIYRVTGQYKKALEYQDSTTMMKDSISGVEKFATVNRLQIKYQTAEKDKQLSQNQLIIAQQNNKIAHKNILMLSIGGTLLLLLLVSTGVYLQTTNKQRSLEKENKISILKAAVAGGDSERTRIARELHDGIGGMLSAAMMRFSSMHHENSEITQTAAYSDAMGILREMGDEIRKTAHNLMPEVLMKQSLAEAVHLYCNNVQEEGILKIDFQSYGSADGITQSDKLNLYRIIQELLKNAAMHSGANRVLVQLLQNENKLIVSVEDNGIGFSTRELKGGLGLHNIRTRVSSMDGHFTLESERGKGTTAIIELELKPPASEADDRKIS